MVDNVGGNFREVWLKMKIPYNFWQKEKTTNYAKDDQFCIVI